MMAKPNRPDVIASLDQAATGFINIARLMGEYYQELVRCGIPVDLAYQLLRDAHRITLTPKAPPLEDE